MKINSSQMEKKLFTNTVKRFLVNFFIISLAFISISINAETSVITPTGKKNDRLEVAFLDGDYRTKTGGVWNNRNNAASTATWQKYSSLTDSWLDISTSPAGVGTNVYLENSVEIPVSTTINDDFKIIIKDGVTLTYKPSNAWTFRNIIIKSGGILDMQTRLTVLTGGNFEIEDAGNFWYNFTAASGATLTTTLWAGNEIFHPNSNFIIKNHEAGSDKYFLPLTGSITPNTFDGVTAYFGNLICDSSGSSVRLTTNNFNNTTLTHGNLEIRPNTSHALLYGSVNWTVGKDFVIGQNSFNPTASPTLSVSTGNVITINVKGNFINNSKSNFRLSNATTGTIILNIDGNFELKDEGKFDVKFSGATAEVNLKGDLLVGSTCLLRSSAASLFNFTGTGDGLSAATTQNIDIATTLSEENSNISFNIKPGAYVRLLNRDFELGTSSRLTVESGSTLDFGFISSTALNVARVGSTVGQSFGLDSGGILKVTSPQGISRGGSGYTGNVQVGSSTVNRIFSPAAIYHFLGKENQITGNGVPNQLTGKLIVEMDTQTAAQDDLEFRSSSNTSFGTAGGANGILEIRKGKVVDEPGNGFRNYNGVLEDGEDATQRGDLVMSGGRYVVSGSGTKPSLSGVYSLSGGCLEFAGAGAVKIRTKPFYHNVDISGSNVETGGKKFQINNLLRITESAILTVPLTLDTENPYVVTARKGIQIAEGGKALFKNNANLMQDTDAENSGNITMERKASVPSSQYNFWSSPVKNQALYDLYDVPDNTVMVYNSTNDKFSILPKISNPKSLFAKAYSIKGSATATPNLTTTFVGQPNNENSLETKTISLSTAGNNYNLIGNPFPSNLDLTALYSDPQNTSVFYNEIDETPTAFFWDNSSNLDNSQVGSGYSGANYAILNLSTGIGTPAPRLGSAGKRPNGIVKPGQGFIIRAAESGGSITFKNSFRTSTSGSNGVYYKVSDTAMDKFYLRLTTPNDINLVIALAYNPEAQNSFERFDSAVFSDSVSENFYSLSSDQKKLAIQSRNFSVDDIISLGIKTSKVGNQTISLEDKSGIFTANQTVYLKDKLLNKITNLSNSDYNFQSAIGTDPGRFEIRFKDEMVLGTGNSEKSDFLIYKNGRDLVIKSSMVLGKIKIYDLSGKLVKILISEKTAATIDLTNLADGPYIVNTENSGESKTKKILK